MLTNADEAEDGVCEIQAVLMMVTLGLPGQSGRKGRNGMDEMETMDGRVAET